MKKHLTPKGVLVALCLMLSSTTIYAQTLTVSTSNSTVSASNSIVVPSITVQRPRGNDTIEINVSFSVTNSNTSTTMKVYGNASSNGSYNQPIPGIYWKDGSTNEYDFTGSFANKKLVITSAATIRSGVNSQPIRIIADGANDRIVTINLYGNDTTITNTSNGFVISPRAAIVKPSGTNSVTITCRDLNNGNTNRVWTLQKGNSSISPSVSPNYITGYSISNNNQTATMTFYKNIDTGDYTITLTRGTGSNTVTYTQTFTIYPANMWAGVDGGKNVAAFHIIDGRFFAGPTLIFDPYPNSTTNYTTAIGRSPYPSPDSGYFYYLDQYDWSTGSNSTSNSGKAIVKAATGSGDSVNTQVGILDFNGSNDNNTFGFVRLGMDSTTTGSYGWILGRQTNSTNANLMLARFKSNGMNTINSTNFIIVDSAVSVTGGVGASNFNNGDLCLDSLGRIFAVANTTSTSTELYIGFPAGANTILEKKWDIYDNLGNEFDGSVNGVCFDALGGLYLSTSRSTSIFQPNTFGGTPTAGIYYADPSTVQSQAEANSVNLRLIYPTNTLEDYAGEFTDLGTNVFPNTIYTLPVKLEDIHVSKKGNYAEIKWVTATEQNTEKFEVYRSLDGLNWQLIQTVGAKGNSIEKTHYVVNDPIDGLSGNVLYRIRSVDFSGFGEHSKVITLKLSASTTGVDVTLQPNPARDYMTLNVTSRSQQSMKYLIYGQDGRVVNGQTLQLQPGVQSIDISDDIRNLGLGVYLIELHVNGEVWTERFTKI